MARYRIMVVDDDPDVRFVVTSLLALDFETTQALNGLDALEKIDRYEPDMLLMDVSMPVMNGIACCQAIKRNEEFNDLPVIYLSATGDPLVKAQALSAGGLAFVEKPFETRELIALINEKLTSLGVQPRAKHYSTEEVARIDATPLQHADATEEDGEPIPGTATATTPIPPPLEERNEATGRVRRVFGKRPPPSAAPTPDAVPDTVVPAEPDTAVPLDEPPAAAPDYRRISQELNKRALEAKERIRSREERETAARESAENLRRLSDSESPTVDDSAADAPSPAPAPPVAPPPMPRRSPAPSEPVIPATWRRADPDDTKPPAPPEVSIPRREVAEDMRPVAPPPQRPARPSARPAAPAGPSPAEVLAQRRLGALGKSAAKPVLRPRVLVIIGQPRELDLCNNALRGVAEYLPLEDPVEAVVLIARFQPDIVVMGIHEERFSGLQLAHMLKTNPRLSHIEVVFVQGPQADSKHLAAARLLTTNAVLRRPLTEDGVRNNIQAVVQRADFRVREKNLPYGVYVKEVLKAAEADRRKENKHREKESYKEEMHSLLRFMAQELKDYKEPEGYDELKGVGRKVHRVE